MCVCTWENNRERWRDDGRSLYLWMRKRSATIARRRVALGVCAFFLVWVCVCVGALRKHRTTTAKGTSMYSVCMEIFINYFNNMMSTWQTKKILWTIRADIFTCIRFSRQRWHTIVSSHTPVKTHVAHTHGHIISKFSQQKWGGWVVLTSESLENIYV